MSQQPPRQLTPEERELIKAKTRTTNVFTWFAGLGIIGMLGVAAAAILPFVCICVIILIAMATPTR